MIIAISGSVGVGKTTIAQLLAQKLNFNCIELNEIANEFKIESNEHLQTFDFDVKACLNYIEKKYTNNDYVLEGHFAHLLRPEFVDILIIINRDISQLHAEYVQRGYNEQKIKDNLEVETLNVCFYEAEEEGYDEKQLIVIENSSSDEDIDLDDIVDDVYRKVNKKLHKLQR